MDGADGEQVEGYPAAHGDTRSSGQIGLGRLRDGELYPNARGGDAGPDREVTVALDVAAHDARDAAGKGLADCLLVDVVEVEPPQAATVKPPTAVSAEPGPQLVPRMAEVRTTMDSPSTIRVNRPKRSGMCETWPGTDRASE